MDALLSPRRRRLITNLGTLGLLGAAGLAAGCGARAPRVGTVRFEGSSMGSTYSVRLAGGPFADELAAAARDAVASALDEVVRSMSSYEPGSDVGRFNRHRATTALPVAPSTRQVIERAQQVARASGGAFDITVAPLVGAWGFGADASPRAGAPATESLAAPIGWQRLELGAATGPAWIRKQHADLRIDLSGIAKGHAVDRAARALDSLGIARYMVEAGGEIRTRGLNGDGRPWQIAIERPDAWPQAVHRVLPMSGLSIATSGDYRNFYQQGGRRIHHEIDPAARAPTAHRLASVSVLHEECMAADAWATALFVAGPERGFALAREQRLAALFIVREPGGALRDLASPVFDALGDA